jgi:hypothetical protein
MGPGMRFFPTYEVSDFCADCSLARFLESRGMLEHALELPQIQTTNLTLLYSLAGLKLQRLLLKKPRVNPNGSNSGYKEHRMVLEKYNRIHEVLNLIVMWFSQKEMGRELGLMSPCEGWTYSFAA